MSKENINSGLSLTLIDEATSKNSKIGNSILNFLTRFLIVFSLSVGSIFTFSSMMNFKQIEWINYVVITICSMLFVTIYKLVKKSNLVLFVSLGLVAVAALLLLDFTVTGFKALYDQGVASACEAMYWTPPDNLIDWEDAFVSNTTYCLALFSFLITSLTAYFVVAKTQFIGAFLSTFPLFCIGSTFACVADKLPFSILMSAWAAMLVLHISNRQKNTVKHKNADKTNVSREFVYDKKTSRFGGSALVMAVAIFLVFTLTTNTLVSIGFEKGEGLENLRKTIKKTTLNVYDLVTGVDHDASLKDGDLTTLGDRKPQDRNYATLQLPNLDENVYLKGYVGSVYTGSAWEEFDDETYKQIAGIKKYLADEDLFLPTIIGDLLFMDFDEEKIEPVEFKLSNFRREKQYAYTTNGVISNPAMTGYQDVWAKPEYTDSYTYRAYYRLQDYIAVTLTSGFNSKYFQSYWDAYCNFVYDNYLFLPDGIDDIRNLSVQLQGETIFKTVDNVRGFLTDNAEFSNYAQKLADGNDFASQFLWNNGKGYSPHFATSAAVMLRTLGIPARYVEGYRIDAKEIAAADGNDDIKTLTLTDGHHHAWIEVFDRTYGWIPVEVTNGFYSKSFEQEFNDAKAAADELIENPNAEIEAEPDVPFEDPFENMDEGGEEEAVEEVEDDDLKEYKENNLIKILIIVLSIIFGIALLCALALVIRRIIIIKKRTAFFTKQVFNNDDYRKQIILAFDLIVRMLKFVDSKAAQTASFEEFKELIINNFYDFSESDIDIDETMRIYEKALFSKLLMRESDSDKVLDLLDEFSYDVSSRLTFFSRLKWMFIDVLS